METGSTRNVIILTIDNVARYVNDVKCGRLSKTTAFSLLFSLIKSANEFISYTAVDDDIILFVMNSLKILTGNFNKYLVNDNNITDINWAKISTGYNQSVNNITDIIDESTSDARAKNTIIELLALISSTRKEDDPIVFTFNDDEIVLQDENAIKIADKLAKLRKDYLVKIANNV